MCTVRSQNDDSDETQMCTVRTQNDDSDKTKMCTDRTQILPTSEWQVRPLTKLEPKQQLEAWSEAVN